ncbi:MAG: TIGR00730 family Rossman fold protein [Alphaproteobacteria bacterium]|nr:TIGR00730 family Rossman fold protein [Alphaproteobacteria bacterium]
MTKFDHLAVFCGSRLGNDSIFKETALELGKELAKNNVALTYGAGHTGIMGTIAKSCLDNGGKVYGHINDLLNNAEPILFDMTDIRVYGSLHERKDAMFKEADAFCAMPGGIGTLDELFEIVTLRQINEINKPIIVCNINGFWTPFKEMIDTLIKTGFADESNARLVTYVDNVKDVIPTIRKELGLM